LKESLGAAEEINEAWPRDFGKYIVGIPLVNEALFESILKSIITDDGAMPRHEET